MSDYMQLALYAKKLHLQSGAGRHIPYFVFMTDRDRIPDPCAVVMRLPRGSLVVVRDYDYPGREAYAAAIVRAARRRRVRVVIAGDGRLARNLRADGVHLPEYAGFLLPRIRHRFPRWLITMAAHGRSAVVRANGGGADAILVSPVFATASHPGDKLLNIIKFRCLARCSVVPVLALGGVNPGTIRRLRHSLAAGVAGIEMHVQV